MAKKIGFQNRIKNRAQETVDAAKDKLQDVKEQAEDYVADNPLKSTLIAAAVGAVVAVGVTLVLVHPRKKSILDILKDFI